jgi:hypothetical protein
MGTVRFIGGIGAEIATTVAIAMPDRLLHHARIVSVKADSSGMKERTKIESVSIPSVLCTTLYNTLLLSMIFYLILVPKAIFATAITRRRCCRRSG